MAKEKKITITLVNDKMTVRLEGRMNVLESLGMLKLAETQILDNHREVNKPTK